MFFVLNVLFFLCSLFFVSSGFGLRGHGQDETYSIRRTSEIGQFVIQNPDRDQNTEEAVDSVDDGVLKFDLLFAA